jgi:rhomboid protease GluP
LLHIFFNLLWVRQLFPQIEEYYGSARAFILFSLSGAAGFLLSNLVLNTPTVGASGSVFGLIAAAIVYGRHHGGTWAAVVVRQLWQMAILMFLMGFLLSGVNNIAHLGGFLGGYLVATWFTRLPAREGRMAWLAALALALVTLGGFVASFAIVTAILITGRG